eukprot:2601720-Alexandrium_andersonii.AAC.1
MVITSPRGAPPRHGDSPRCGRGGGPVRPRAPLVQRERARGTAATDEEVQVQALPPLQHCGQHRRLRRRREVDPRGGRTLQGGADLEGAEVEGDAIVDPRAVFDGRPRVDGLIADTRGRRLLRRRENEGHEHSARLLRRS